FTAEDVTPAALAALGGEDVAQGDVADINEIESAWRNERHAALPEAKTESAHHRAFVVAGADEIAGIHDDHVIPMTRGGERELFGGTLGVDVIDLQMIEFEWRLFVEDGAVSRSADRDDAGGVHEPSARRQCFEDSFGAVAVNRVHLLKCGA